MKVGDLVQKRWGKIEPHEQGTLGIYIGNSVHATVNPAFDGYSIKVLYSGEPVRFYRKDEFEVISESR